VVHSDVEKQLRELRDSTAHLRGNAEGRLGMHCLKNQFLIIDSSIDEELLF
jgi:hypothetical protein